MFRVEDLMNLSTEEVAHYAADLVHTPLEVFLLERLRASATEIEDTRRELETEIAEIKERLDG